MKKFSIIIMMMFILSACGGGGGGSSSPVSTPTPTATPEPTPQYPLTGSWSGTWASSDGQRGNASANLTQNGLAVNGTFSITNSVIKGTHPIGGTVPTDAQSGSLDFRYNYAGHYIIFKANYNQSQMAILIQVDYYYIIQARLYKQ